MSHVEDPLVDEGAIGGLWEDVVGRVSLVCGDCFKGFFCEGRLVLVAGLDGHEALDCRAVEGMVWVEADGEGSSCKDGADDVEAAVDVVPLFWLFPPGCPLGMACGEHGEEADVV